MIMIICKHLMYNKSAGVLLFEIIRIREKSNKHDDDDDDDDNNDGDDHDDDHDDD